MDWILTCAIWSRMEANAQLFCYNLHYKRHSLIFFMIQIRTFVLFALIVIYENNWQTWTDERWQMKYNGLPMVHLASGIDPMTQSMREGLICAANLILRIVLSDFLWDWGILHSWLLDYGTGHTISFTQAPNSVTTWHLSPWQTSRKFYLNLNTVTI